jgi:AcrR family transcriptional regulator
LTSPSKPVRAPRAAARKRVPEPLAADIVRHAPVQARGHRRVQLLLEAAAGVIAEVGVDNATTNAVAARASTSVGVLYRFFPNKQALVEALAQRYLEDIDELLSRQEQEGIAEWPLQQAIDWVVRAIVAFHEAHPAFQHVYRAVRGSSTPRGVALLDQIKRVIDRLLALRTPTAPARARELHATVAVEAAHALVVHAVTLPAAARERLTHEAVVLLVRYLEPAYVPAATAPATGSRKAAGDAVSGRVRRPARGSARPG